MADPPSFRHIHCSSRFDRSAASLDDDITNWQAECSLITLTEVQNDHRAAQLRAKGWGYYAAKNANFADDCAIGWDSTKWKRVSGHTRKLTDQKYIRGYSGQAADIYSVTAVLKRADTGHRLLVSVTHFPAHIEGQGGWRTELDHWQGRKRAYLNAMTNWSTHVKDQVRKNKIDGALIVADWNLSLKVHWVRDLINNHWGKAWDMAWQNMPTTGGSLGGGPQAPPGAPGKGYHDRIIDGSLYHHLKVVNEPHLMSRVSSSDHRPYSESFGFLGKAEHDPTKGIAGGDLLKKADEWWGFGDYMDDEKYPIPAATGESGGEVL